MGIAGAIADAGSGARTGKLEEVGDVLRGVVISAELRQARDDDNKPDFWEDGNPKQQVVILLQTTLDEGPNDEGKDDDGKRAFYIKWWGLQKKAFLEAVRLAEVDDLYEGDEFAVKYLEDGDKDPKKKSWSAPKILKFKVKPAPKSAGLSDEFGDDEDEAPAAKKAAPVERKPVKKAAPAKKATSAKAALADAGLEPEDF